jgi:hypothetical protein
MTAVEFVRKISQVVYHSTVTDCLSLIKKVPGRKPSPKLVALSQWFNQLPESDKEKVQDVIQLTARQSVFGFCAVLDGVRQVEDSESRGTLELHYLQDGRAQLLNDSNAELLHDLFNQIIPFEGE